MIVVLCTMFCGGAVVLRTVFCDGEVVFCDGGIVH